MPREQTQQREPRSRSSVSALVCSKFSPWSRRSHDPCHKGDRRSCTGCTIVPSRPRQSFSHPNIRPIAHDTLALKRRERSTGCNAQIVVNDGAPDSQLRPASHTRYALNAHTCQASIMPLSMSYRNSWCGNTWKFLVAVRERVKP